MNYSTNDPISDPVADPVILQISPQVKALIEALSDETLSTHELMGKLGLSHRQTFRNNYLRPALKSGLVVRTILEKPNSRNQRYRRIR